MMPVIFIVRVNIDDLGRAARLCLSDTDKAALLEGFLYGATGGPAEPSMPARWQSGCAIGAESFRHAKEQQAKQSEKGLKSGEARRTGKQPRFEPRLNHGSNHGSTTDGTKPTSQQEGGSDRATPASAVVQSQPPPPPDDGLFSNPAPTLRVPQQTTLGDLEATYPCLLITREDRDRMQAIFRLYGWDILHPSMAKIAAIAAQRPSKQRRVFVSEVAEWLSKNFELEESDYKRAGIPMPSKDK